uniref:Si:dkey-4e7.3 n=1 Tax=Oryzias melastigma TaxID=30732 RepID=A0A3B3BZ34_ORYME
MANKKLLVDVDCGVDDAQAIMLALAAPNVQLLAITCVHGNTSVENVCKNSLRVLQACDRLEVSSVPAMIRIVNENPGEVSLVATGPLTNLALAVRLDPSLPSKLRGLYIMGGNTESRGNTRVCGEFNFIADPEAAYIVLKDYQCPTYLACWEFTCYNKLSWDFCETWLAQDSHKARFMETIFRHSIQASQSKSFEKVFFAGTGLTSCDSYAMAAAVDDSFVIESDCYPVSVELTGTHTRGMMVVDTLGFLKKSHTAFIMKKVDMEKFKQMMMAALK